MTSVGRVWAIAALSRPLLETGCGGLEREREVSVGGWKGCRGVKELELSQVSLPKGSFSRQSGNRVPEGSWVEQAGWQREKAEKCQAGRKAHPILQREQPDAAGRGSQIPVN